jgi:hypothetical protein
VLVGCGGDDEDEPPAGGQATPTAEQTQTAPAGETGTATEPAEDGDGAATAPEASPEDEPGGAGDEEPARSLALLTGRDGRIRPRRVRVPAFIAVRVELRSADGGTYALRFGGRRLATGPEISSVSAMFAGLRPGEALVGEPVGGAGNPVRIEATAEPGP